MPATDGVSAFDIPVMVALAMLLLPIAFTGRRVAEGEAPAVQLRDAGVRWLFVGSFAAVLAAFVAVSAARGIDRGDLFEIIVVSIVWSTLIVAGPLVAVVLRRAAACAPGA